MANLTVSTPELVYTPEGNWLALFIDSRDGIVKVKDARAQFAPLSDYINNSLNYKYGSFYSTSSQAATVINTPKAMTLNNTDISNGVSFSKLNNSQISVSTAGVYDLQFSAQVDRVTGTGTDVIDIWLRKQGVDVPNSNTRLTIAGNVNESKVIASWNFFISLNAGEYVELMYSVTDLQVQLIYEAPNLSVPHPATPSLIVTMNKIS